MFTVGFVLPLMRSGFGQEQELTMLVVGFIFFPRFYLLVYFRKEKEAAVTCSM